MYKIMTPLPNPRWRRYLIVYAVLMLAASLLAYTRNLPSFLERIPYYDLIGHFFLLGTLGLLTLKATEPWKLTLGPLVVAVAPVLITVFSIADEFFQKTSPNRTFSLLDMAANAAGIWVFYFVYCGWRRVRPADPNLET